MKLMPKVFSIAFFFLFLSFSGFSQEKTFNKDQRYIFFFHNKFVQENPLNATHAEYGKAEYNEILESFRKDNFIVFSEKRKKNTNSAEYAEKIVKQVKALIKKGGSAKSYYRNWNFTRWIYCPICFDLSL